jgi:hypothetical protein
MYYVIYANFMPYRTYMLCALSNCNYQQPVLYMLCNPCSTNYSLLSLLQPGPASSI